MMTLLTIVATFVIIGAIMAAFLVNPLAVVALLVLLGIILMFPAQVAVFVGIVVLGVGIAYFVSSR